MKVLLTGATGFLGSHLAKALLKLGHVVIALKRSTSDVSRLSGILPDLVMYDLGQYDLDVPFREHREIEAVIHTATCYGRGGESAQEISEVNTFFPLRLLEACHRHGTLLFINTDTSLPRLLNPYALSKKQFSEWGQFLASGGPRFVNLVAEHFYGPGDDRSKFTTHLIRSCLANVPSIALTAGEQKRDFIYIDDAVAAYMTVLERCVREEKPFQEFEVGSGTAVTIRKLAETVHRLTGSKTVLNFGAVPYRDNEVMESLADIDALCSLGWNMTIGLEEGLSRTIRIERQNGVVS